jgi:ribose transport system ATP-binding protein
LAEPRIEITGLRKSFGTAPALRGVDISAGAGEVHAILGENGAGKSTLMKILAGALAPDGGAIQLGGRPYRPRGPGDARRAGIAMVHQELSLCPHLTVAENVLLGAEPARLGFLRGRAMDARVRAALAPVLSEDTGMLRPDSVVSGLPPASRQLVEIARALSQDALQILLFDEPTSSLGRGDVERLFAVIRGLRARGLTVLYVSHFLEEAQSIADSFTVLRDGETVGRGAMSDVTLPDLVGMMAGRRIDALFPRTARTPGEEVVRIDDLAGVVKPERASLTLRRGEVLGIAGLLGAGRTELLRAIFGLDPVRSGALRVKAFVGPASPAARLAQGVGFASEDRKGEGLSMSMSIADNLTLSRLSDLGPPGLVLGRRQRAAAQRWIDTLGIRARDPGQLVSELSGGNQQKVALGRLLHHDVDVLLLDEPTRGIDIASKAQMYELIDRLAVSGKALLMVSSYLPELLGVCDRIAVMRRGVLGPARPAGELDEHAVLLEAAGGEVPRGRA